MFEALENIAIDALGVQGRAVQAATWSGIAAANDEAGLYTWWVDAKGADALTQGLGEPVQPGLIYGGQAGATRWPSGTKSDQTLNGRIGSNHLSGSIRGSTFRRTLAASLTDHLGLQIVSGRKVGLSTQSEAELSQWMRAHLSVSAWPFPDRDDLEAMEERVLLRLNPPLNLRGMPKTPLRAALSRAPKGLTAASDSQPSFVEQKVLAPVRKRKASSVTLHEEIADILIAAGGSWMTCKEVADHVNERGRYQKRDKTAVTGFQVHGRTRNYPDLFEREGQRVRLLKT